MVKKEDGLLFVSHRPHLLRNPPIVTIVQDLERYGISETVSVVASRCQDLGLFSEGRIVIMHLPVGSFNLAS